MISTNIYVVSVLLAVSFSAILYYNAQAGGGQRHKHYVRVDTDKEVVSPPSTPYADIINPPSPFADDESAPTMIVSPTLPVEEEEDYADVGEEEEGTPVSSSSSWWKKIQRLAKATKADGKSSKVHRGKVGKGGKDDDYCTDMSSFQGRWVYLPGCDGISQELDIYPKGRGRKFIYKEKVAGGECTSEGSFKPGDQLTLDEEGNCMLDLIHLSRRGCNGDSSLSVRVLSPKEENNKGGMLQLYFSRDGGNTFYNEDNPREALPDVSKDEESRRVLHQQARRRLRCQSDTECSAECKEQVGYTGEVDLQKSGCCQNAFAEAKATQIYAFSLMGIKFLGTSLESNYNPRCYLNAPGNACTCDAGGYSSSTGEYDHDYNHECFIDEKCSGDIVRDGKTFKGNTTTWQDGECRIKPWEDCGNDIMPCTTGWKCWSDYSVCANT